MFNVYEMNYVKTADLFRLVEFKKASTSFQLPSVKIVALFRGLIKKGFASKNIKCSDEYKVSVRLDLDPEQYLISSVSSLSS